MTQASGGSARISHSRSERLSRTIGWTVLVGLTLFLSIEYVWLYATSRDIAWDEGYLMITMRGFIDGHILYDEVFTQYGPTYYLLRAPIFTLFGLSLDHDSTRLLGMATWMAAAILLAIGVWRSTGTVFLCWFAFLQAIIHLSTIANEPGHPQEIVVLLLMGIFCMVAKAPISRLAWGFVAVLVALLTTTKVNVGVFALTGLAAYWLSTTRRLSPKLAWLVVGAAVAMPFALMRQHLDELWAFTYAVAAAVAIGPVVAAMLDRDRRAGTDSRFGIIGFSLVLVLATGVVLAATLSAGTSASGLLQGLIVAPLQLPDVFSMPIDASGWALANAFLSLLCAAGVKRFAHTHRSAEGWIVGLKLGYGAMGSLVLVASLEAQLFYLAPWLWVVLVPLAASPGEPERATDATPRFVVCVIAAFELLQAYPVAGSQVAWATLLLVATYAFCLHDAARFLTRQVGLPAWGPRSTDESGPAPSRNAVQGDAPETMSRLRPLGVLGCVVLLWAYSSLWLELPKLREHFATLTPLNLPGASLVRLEPHHVALYQGLTAYLTENSDGFVTYPGYHSLYFWTGMNPPTQYNVTVWNLLSDVQQAAIVTAMRNYRRPRIVLTRDYLGQWEQESPDSLRPFAKFVLAEYEPVGMIGPCILLAPKSAAQSR